MIQDNPHLKTVRDHVRRGAERRSQELLTKERFPDHDPGRWILQLVASTKPLFGNPRPREGREDRTLEIADAWVELAAIAQAAAVSTALVAYEDLEERLEDQIYNRIHLGDLSGQRAVVNAAEAAPTRDENEVPF